MFVATVLGKGVYFARDASYSLRSTYSPPDATGKRCVYLASVLAGEYAQGHQDMITAPPKNPNNATITYDTVVDNVTNPSVYVVFHDTQNYPDYLITFK
jgi:poly [ADP-ribose] polymerase 10/14/15